jgi:hypothetical protein
MQISSILLTNQDDAKCNATGEFNIAVQNNLTTDASYSFILFLVKQILPAGCGERGK